MVRSVAALLVLIVLSVATGGCLDLVPHSRDTYVLSLTLVDLTDSAERRAGIGGHCGNAQWEGDKLLLERKALEEQPVAGPLIIVKPALQGSWATIGTEGWFRAAPADIAITVDGQRVLVAQIDRTAGQVQVDGAPVDLPHAWSHEDHNGTWRVDLGLNEGPGRHHRFTRDNCM